MRTDPLVLLVLAACSSGAGDGRDGPICPQYYSTRPLGLPAGWSGSQPVQCRVFPPDQPPDGPWEVYALCTNPPMQQLYPGQCEEGPGDVVCRDYRRTVLCDSNDDCPAHMSCLWNGGAVGDRPMNLGDSYGYCERTCSTDQDCIWCGLHCETSIGTCSPYLDIPLPDGGAILPDGGV